MAKSITENTADWQRRDKRYDAVMETREIKELDPNAPLYEVVGTVAAFWAAANVGYHLLFPALGYSLSYNLSPVAIALYYFAWSLVSFAYFYRLFRSWAPSTERLWLYGAQSLAFAATIGALIYALSLLPSLRGPALAPYTDLLFVTPWYFLPKAFEVLMQQILITTLVLEFYARFRSFSLTLSAYAFTFVGAHIFLFALGSAPAAYSLSITLWAAASTWVFPYLLLRVKSGFVYTYAIHLTSYIILAAILRAFPPSGYFGI
jgi:hypothetical protein